MPMRRSLLLALIASSSSAGGQSASSLRLVPQPREARPGRDLVLSGGINVIVPTDSDDAFAARDLRSAPRENGPAAGGSRGRAGGVLLPRSTPAARTLLQDAGVAFDNAMREEGYAIIPQGSTLTVVGSTSAGIFYGAQTVKQLVRGRGASAVLQLAAIRDWPALAHRGLHDDLSRGPVPTLDYMKRQIRTFAAFKINTYSPYFEHTLEYRANPLIAPPGGALSRADVKELVAYRSEEHTSELQLHSDIVCRLLLEKKNTSCQRVDRTPPASHTPAMGDTTATPAPVAAPAPPPPPAATKVAVVEGFLTPEFVLHDPA